MVIAPFLVVAYSSAGAGAQDDRPPGVFTVCSGMTLECFLFPPSACGASAAFGPLLDQMGVTRATTGPGPDRSSRRVTTSGPESTRNSLPSRSVLGLS